jgi:hypothetical protein
MTKADVPPKISTGSAFVASSVTKKKRNRDRDIRDDNEQRSTAPVGVKKTRKSRGHHNGSYRNYELLGAPTLLYRRSLMESVDSEDSCDDHDIETAAQRPRKRTGRKKTIYDSVGQLIGQTRPMALQDGRHIHPTTGMHRPILHCSLSSLELLRFDQDQMASVDDPRTARSRARRRAMIRWYYPIDSDKNSLQSELPTSALTRETFPPLVVDSTLETPGATPLSWPQAQHLVGAHLLTRSKYLLEHPLYSISQVFVDNRDGAQYAVGADPSREQTGKKSQAPVAAHAADSPSDDDSAGSTGYKNTQASRWTRKQKIQHVVDVQSHLQSKTIPVQESMRAHMMVEAQRLALNKPYDRDDSYVDLNVCGSSRRSSSFFSTGWSSLKSAAALRQTELSDEQSMGIRRILDGYSRFDSTYVPGQYRKCQGGNVAPREAHRLGLFKGGQLSATVEYRRARQLMADPVQHAPFLPSSLIDKMVMESLVDDPLNDLLGRETNIDDDAGRGSPSAVDTVAAAVSDDFDDESDASQQARNRFQPNDPQWRQKYEKLVSKSRRIPGIRPDDPNSPLSNFGNCLVAFQCWCEFCCANPASSSWCLLHPAGTFLDQIQVSFLSLPNDHDSSGGAVSRRRSGCSAVSVGYSVRQIARGGNGRKSNTFFVRTTCHLLSLRLDILNSQPKDASSCSHLAEISVSYQVDYRSCQRFRASLLPVAMCAHPRFGNQLTDPKLAVLYESGRVPGGACNTIYHFCFGSEMSNLRKTEHVIRNLERIEHLDFNSHHPMLLWTAARSFVQPVLRPDPQARCFRAGFGTSLFSVDLRSDQASFQWSPSAEGKLVEGCCAISGLHTDWTRENTIWVVSSGAAKVWQLDARMPCRPVTCWSLPFHCDDFGAHVPVEGIQGAGTILTQPALCFEQEAELKAQSSPVLSVSLNTETYGIHLYQEPAELPRFQTRSVECAVGSHLSRIEGMSVCSSATFPLPDVGQKVFTCGLAAFRCPPSRLLSPTQLSGLGVDTYSNGIISIVSMTNHGDLYCHNIFETSSPDSHSFGFDDLPIGARCIPVEGLMDGPGHSMKSSNGVLKISLCNRFPPPSTTVNHPCSNQIRARAEPLLSAQTEVNEPEPAKLEPGQVESTQQSFHVTASQPAQCVLECSSATEENSADGQTIAIPENLWQDYCKASSSTTEFLDLDQVDLVLQDGQDGNTMPRSDVTRSLLEDVVENWGT